MMVDEIEKDMKTYFSELRETMLLKFQNLYVLDKDELTNELTTQVEEFGKTILSSTY